MTKWIGRIIFFGFLAVVVFAIGAGVFSYFYLKGIQPPDAQYGIQVYYRETDGNIIPTRLYYTDAIKIENGSAILKVYWSYNGERYIKHSGELTIPQPYKIIRRKSE